MGETTDKNDNDNTNKSKETNEDQLLIKKLQAQVFALSEEKIEQFKVKTEEHFNSYDISDEEKKKNIENCIEIHQMATLGHGEIGKKTSRLLEVFVNENGKRESNSINDNDKKKQKKDNNDEDDQKQDGFTSYANKDSQKSNKEFKIDQLNFNFD